MPGGGEDICIGAIFAKTFALLFLNDTSNYFLPTICKYASLRQQVQNNYSGGARADEVNP